MKKPLQYILAALFLAVSGLTASGVMFSPLTRLAQVAHASGTAVAVSGYAWSSNVGWIDFSGSWPNGVSMDSSSGALTGYAWSSNIGWIEFGGLSGWPTGTGTTGANAAVNLSTGAVTGWARACAGTVPGDCSSMTSRTDGWDGWISLSGTGYGVTYSPSTGAFGGFSWGSDVVGWTDWSLVSTNPTSNTNPPQVTINANPTTVTSGQSSTLTWSATNNPTSCTMSSSPSNLSGSEPTSSAGTSTLAIGSPTTFSLSCSNAYGSGSNSVTVSTTTSSGSGGVGGISMWLNNSAAVPPQTSIHIHPSGSVTLNWNQTAFYTQHSADGVTCSGVSPGKTVAGWTGSSSLSYTAPNNSGLDAVLSGLPVGTYSLAVQCRDNITPATASTTNSVIVDVTNSSIHEQ